MISEKVLMLGFVLPAMFAIGMLGIWNNWIWIGKGGYNLSQNQKPGFFRFWFSIAPRYLLGMKTGMENITLNCRELTDVTIIFSSKFLLEATYGYKRKKQWSGRRTL
jgi:hypothetical protein